MFGEEVQAGGSLGQVLLFGQVVGGGGRRSIGSQFTLRSGHRRVYLVEQEET